MPTKRTGISLSWQPRYIIIYFQLHECILVFCLGGCLPHLENLLAPLKSCGSEPFQFVLSLSLSLSLSVDVKN